MNNFFAKFGKILETRKLFSVKLSKPEEISAHNDIVSISSILEKNALHMITETVYAVVIPLYSADNAYIVFHNLVY